jgi:hypothetical protein
MPFCVRAVVQTASLMVFIFKKFIMVGFKIKCMLPILLISRHWSVRDFIIDEHPNPVPALVALALVLLRVIFDCF